MNAEEYNKLSMFELPKVLLKEKFDVEWTREFLKEHKGIRSRPGHADIWFIDDFKQVLWGQLTTEKLDELIASLNILIEEDLFLEYLAKGYLYIFELVEVICFIEKRVPGKFKTEKLFEWRNQNYPNIPEINPLNCVNKHMIRVRIDGVFFPKDYLIYWLDWIGRPFSTLKIQKIGMSEAKDFPYLQDMVEILKPEEKAKRIVIVNELLSEGTPAYIKDKEHWLVRLLEYSCYFELDSPGSINSTSLHKWVNSDYSEIIKNKEIKNQLLNLVNKAFKIEATT